MAKINQRLLYSLFSSASFAIVGVGIVLPAWIAFHIGGSGLVGWVLLSSSAAALVLAPAAGYLVDRYPRGVIAFCGQSTRAIGLLILAFAAPTGALAPPLLIVSAILGAFGFALLSGALNGILQTIIPEDERMGFALRISLFNQLGIAVGTGAAGIAIDRLGGAVSAVLFGGLALMCLPALRGITATADGLPRPKRLGIFAASNEALAYLLANPRSLSAAVTVGLAFAVIQMTNLLLPGFVSASLAGGSQLFGLLEMTAAGAGMAALALASAPAIARHLSRATTAVLAAAGLFLVLFSFAASPIAAVILYCLAGIFWNVSRAAANGHLLTVVDNAMIGRVQAFTTLLTGGFGLGIYILPTLAPETSEAHLYVVCGVAVVMSAAAPWIWAPDDTSIRAPSA